jgi:hypothetical protein
MQVTEVRAEYRKTVSDGNYGNETFSVALVGAVAEGEMAVTAAEGLTDLARRIVISELRRSANEHIRRAMMTPEERAEDDRRVEAAMRAQWDAERAERSVDPGDTADDGDDDA